MGLRRKEMLIQQQAYFEDKLKDRLSFLSAKGIKSPQVNKDTLVRKFKADIRAVKNRLRVIVANEKRTEEMAKIREQRAAAPEKEQKGGAGEKPKRAPEEGKGKKIKTEKKAASPKAPEGGKSQIPTESLEEGRTTTKKTAQKTIEEPAGQPKTDKQSS
ncbi:MAG: hypothetical protein A2Y69_12560 [Candidatus Aminicenantes bacterium RBG_13_59_9]|nr:MAG: hypothetical protein A2Y69_12560 [Candidatus Aminicenantes bacterium RBG_13_59_9]